MAGCVVTLLAKFFALLAASLAAWLLGLLHYWRQFCIVGGIIALLAALLHCWRHYWRHFCIIVCVFTLLAAYLVAVLLACLRPTCTVGIVVTC